MKAAEPDQPLTWFWFSGCFQQRLPRICTKQLLKPNAGCSCISLHCVETDKSANFCTAEKLFSPTLPRLCILLSNTTIQNHKQGHTNVYESHHKSIQQKHKCMWQLCFGFPHHAGRVCSNVLEEHTDSFFSMTICLRCNGVKWGTNWNQP